MNHLVWWYIAVFNTLVTTTSLPLVAANTVLGLSRVNCNKGRKRREVTQEGEINGLEVFNDLSYKFQPKKMKITRFYIEVEVSMPKI